MKQLQKKMMGILIVLSMLVLFVMPVYGQPSDIAGHWAEKQVNEWIDGGLINGYGDNTFKPDNNITRAEFMSLANRTFGFSEKASINFPDVSLGAWFAEEIAKAIDAGYLSGYDDGTIKPDNPITRLEAARVLTVLLHLNTNGDFFSVNQFKDVSDIPDWGKGYLNAVVSEKYFQGYSDGTVQPSNPITRAEAVTVLSRALGEIFGAAGVYGPEKDKSTIQGNVTISAAGVSLRNTRIEGNLNLTAGVGDGNIQLDNVVVTGRTFVNGGGSHSIVVQNSALGEIVIDKKKGETPGIVAKGTSTIEAVTLHAGARLEETDLTGEGFNFVQVSPSFKNNAELILEGDFTVVVHAPSKIDVTRGNITLEISEEASGSVVTLGKDVVLKKITADAPVEVKGEGAVERAEINIPGVVIEQQVKEVIVKQGVTVSIGGQTMDKSNVVNTGTSSDTGTSSNITKTILIDGMKCDECLAKVKSALSALDGVVSLDVVIGRATVTSNKDVSDAVLKVAVESTGYTVRSISVGGGGSSSDGGGSSSSNSANPPVLTADTAHNTVSQAIYLSFADDPAWRGAITVVKDGSTTLSSSQYTIAAGTIIINAGVLNTGTHTITVSASGYNDATVTQSINSITRTILISGMSCGMCVQHVSNELSAIDGLQIVSVEVGRAVVTLTKEVSGDIIKNAIINAGYTVTSIQ
ncbi:MAG TPA: hypothetical protein DCZ10_02265 [Pelotomaculum sp.]|nr:hypothetical protein [Pelotomaculum sp.]